MSSTAKERKLGSHYLVQEEPKGIKGRLVDLRNLGDGSYRDSDAKLPRHRESPVSRNVRARAYVLQNPSGKGRHEPRHLQSTLAFREMPTPTRLILSRSTFSVLRRGSSSCHVPETRLVVRFQCLEGTGTEQPHNTFYRFALKVLAPSWIFTQHDPTRTLFFLGLVLLIILARTSAGTWNITATTFAGMNHVDAHLHDNFGLLSPRSTFATGALISYLGVAPHKFLTCSYKVISHPSQSQCETGGGAHMVSLDLRFLIFPFSLTSNPQRANSRGLYGFNVASSSLFISTDSINQLLLLKRSQSLPMPRVKRVPSAKHLPFTKPTMSTAKGSSTGSLSIEITEICVESQHILKSVQLSIGSFERESPCLLNATTHNFELSSPCQSSQLSPSESLYLQVRFRGLFRAASKSKIPLDELLSKAEPPTSGDLQPTTDELFKLVERFRVLVIGKVALLYLYSQLLAYSLFLQCGVGKSSLINECFGVKDAVRSFPRLLKIRS
ncbi:uncharacterized protein LACBIDRAFT_333620 [Laccaria bicolor S238N-H82]|uniref:Predicted protein n=1 Tax=Laccaria bicolor (strain S238N-H82 / ATCC MYA-4686) TaxID=486041 RepID=B0DWJ0_LACBS|nr:uncharacterized protein LACBIDRAFT_333620 [Laccaria bicolor S238N-H82]EDR01054.1 predicted protein [Laccaria bicolor S238N-H82]|eukprot:XP_001888273.1 predicted protein [Laccaria bicolor S238N-H82]